MTDDLGTLIAQTGGQLAGLIVKSQISTIPTMFNLVSNLGNPLLWVLPYGVLTAGTAAAALPSLITALVTIGILH